MDLQTEKLKLIDWISKQDDESVIAWLSELVQLRNDSSSKVIGPQFPDNDDHKRILDQRLQEHHLDPNSGKPWSALKSELNSRYGL